MSGWIAISRDIFKHEFFAREPMSEREAWVWMIARAAWEPTRHKVGNDMMDVPRGSFFCTLRELQQAWGWGSDFRVRTFLKRTQAERMIDTKTNAGKTHVTICNYDDYQAAERTENARKTQAPPQNKRTKETINKEQEVSSYEDTVVLALKIFNEAAARRGWPEAKKLTPARKSAIKARLMDADGLDGWTAAIRRAEASDFLCGKTEKAFCLTFDFITKAGSFAKLIEGNYDNRKRDPVPLRFVVSDEERQRTEELFQRQLEKARAEYGH